VNKKNRSLRKFLPFSLLSDEQFDRIIDTAQERSFTKGQVIVEEGAHNTSFYYILAGSVEVFIDSRKKKKKKVNRLRRGNWFGETSLVTGSRTIALVKALTDVRILSVPSGVFISVLRKNPQAQVFFDNYAEKMQLLNRLYRTPLFASETELAVWQITEKLSIRKYSRGQEILRQGDQGTEFFILWEGSVDMFLQTPDKRKKITTMSSPDSFGELALVSDRPRANSVIARGDVTVYVLQKADFLAIVKKDFSLFNRLLGQVYERQKPLKSEKISVTEEWKGGEMLYILRQDVTGQYMRLDEKAYFILNQMDGSTSIQEIAIAFFIKYKQIGVGSLLQLLPMLVEKGFVEIPGLSDELKMKRKASVPRRLLGLLGRAFFINLASFPGERPMQALYDAAGRFVFSRVGRLVLGLVTVAGFASFVYGSSSGSIAPGGVTAAGFLAFIAMFLLHGVFHETAHALVAVRYGVRIGDIGLGLFLLVFLTPHVRNTDMWMIDKKQRIIVSLAGPLVTAFISGLVSICILLVPAGLGAEMSMFALMGYLIALSSLNPLVLSDGYYVLMDLFQMPGLRFRSIRFLRIGLRKALAAGLRKDQWIYLFYSTFALIYMTGVLLYTALDVRKKFGDYIRPAVGEETAHTVSILLVTLVFFIAIFSFLRPLLSAAEEETDIL